MSASDALPTLATPSPRALPGGQQLEMRARGPDHCHPSDLAAATMALGLAQWFNRGLLVLDVVQGCRHETLLESSNLNEARAERRSAVPPRGHRSDDRGGPRANDS